MKLILHYGLVYIHNDIQHCSVGFAKYLYILSEYSIKSAREPKKKKQDFLCDSNIPNYQRAYIRIKGNEVI